MDAANFSIKKIAFSLAFALLIPAAAFAQTPQFSPTQTAINLVGQAADNETVNSTTTPINFTASIAYSQGDVQWLCIENAANFASISPTSVTGLTTPATLTLSVGDCGASLGEFTGTHNATLTLTATDSSGATTVAIPVSYTVGSGGGGGSGSVVANPSSVVQTVAYGGEGTTAVTLTTSSSTPISFTLAGPPVTWATWYQYSGNPGFVSASQPAVLYVTLNGAGLNQTTYNSSLTVNNQTGTLTIAITLNNGVAGTGGSGTGSLSVYPSSIPWSYSTSSSGTFPASTTVTLTSTNGAIGYSATATSSNGWLLVNGGYATSGTVGVTPLVIGPTTNLAALTPGTYNGTVNISGSDGSTALITVTVTITGAGSGIVTITPSPISLSAAVNGAQTSTVVTINSGVSGTLSATVTGSGLSVSVPNSNITAGVATTVTIFGNPSGLTNSTYVGTLNVSVAGNSAGAQINFVVGTGSTGTGSTTSIAPSQLNFYYEPNTSMQISQDQQVYLGGSGSFTITSSTANSSTNWLSALTTSGTLPATVYVLANATGLTSGTYTGQLTIFNTTTSQSSVVNVTLLVQGITTLYASPGDWIFNYIANASSVNQVQAITVATSDGSPAAVSAAVTNPTATPWLAVAGGGTASATALTVTTNATGLANGVYSGSITVSGGYNTLTVPIVLTVAGSSVSTGTGGTLTLGALSPHATGSGQRFRGLANSERGRNYHNNVHCLLTSHQWRHHVVERFSGRDDYGSHHADSFSQSGGSGGRELLRYNHSDGERHGSDSWGDFRRRDYHQHRNQRHGYG